MSGVTVTNSTVGFTILSGDTVIIHDADITVSNTAIGVQSSDFITLSDFSIAAPNGFNIINTQTVIIEGGTFTAPSQTGSAIQIIGSDDILVSEVEINGYLFGMNANTTDFITIEDVSLDNNDRAFYLTLTDDVLFTNVNVNLSQAGLVLNDTTNSNGAITMTNSSIFCAMNGVNTGVVTVNAIYTCP